MELPVHKATGTPGLECLSGSWPEARHVGPVGGDGDSDNVDAAMQDLSTAYGVDIG